jgi:hypothetical protein
MFAALARLRAGIGLQIGSPFNEVRLDPLRVKHQPALTQAHARDRTVLRSLAQVAGLDAKAGSHCPERQ